MQEPLVRSFDSLDAAQQARQHLEAAGIPAERIELQVIAGEAGPAEGNFLVGNGITNHGGRPNANLSGGEIPYDENLRRIAPRGEHLLLVHALEGELRLRAEEALRGHDAVDPAALGRAGCG